LEPREGENILTALRRAGYADAARRLVLNTVTMGMVSDTLHHLYEGLSCLERRKSIVALNVLRKPLLENLIYLSWIVSDEDSFYEAFSRGEPELLTSNRIGNIRKDILISSLRKTDLHSYIDSENLWAILFDSRNEVGLYGLFQHAVHLITVQRLEIRTSPENFNFIFKDPSDDDVYELIYHCLPSVILYLSSVVCELFDRIEPMEEGARTALRVRSLLGAHLLKGDKHAKAVCAQLGKTFNDRFMCPTCFAPISVTKHNACRIVMTDSFRCTHCRRVSVLPFSWFF
jgi:hypothetical protein